jgi:hypothetical protein
MTMNQGKLSWAPKVPRAKIQRLYVSDAQGFSDEELIDEVGWGLWSRCDSILTVTAAHFGRVRCPSCGALIERAAKDIRESEDPPSPLTDEVQLHCAACDWQMPWKIYHQSYKGKQLIGINAIEYFRQYYQVFPKVRLAQEKMLLIDQLIHAFHNGLTELGRPVGANLIEGTLKEVIHFLDALTDGPASAAGIGNSRDEWRRNLEGLSWAHLFIEPNPGPVQAQPPDGSPLT